METVWVDAVDAAISDTKADPWARAERLKEVQSEYLKQNGMPSATEEQQ